ncbi:MAG: ribbon-helix-helix domain-containing protein [Geminicoccaceae bacterium]
MCRIYAATDPREYEPVTRSVRLHGVVTSIRLEGRFWAILDQLAAGEGVTTPRFLAKLYDEIIDQRGEVRNFASLLRVVATIYVTQPAASRPAARRVAELEETLLQA